MSNTHVKTEPKKKISGCMLAVIIAGVLMLLCAIAATTAVVLALRTPEGIAAIDIIKTAASAQKSPGAEALRGYGCEEVGVLPLAALNRIAAFADAGPVIPDFAAMTVTCFAPPADRSCDSMAAAFVSRDRPSGPIRFSIVDERHERCAGFYDVDGRAMSAPAEAAPR